MTKKTPAPKTPKDLATALDALEQQVEQLEAGEIPLEAALEAFENGTTLVRQCQEILQRAEQTVQRLQHNAGDNNLQDFDPASDT